MDLNKKTSLKSCSAVQSRTAGSESENSSTGTLTSLSSIRLSGTTTDFLHEIINKKMTNQKSRPSTSNKVCEVQKETNFDIDESISLCSSCTAQTDDLISYVIQELEYKVRDLNKELSKERNMGQLLKKDIFVAKKVVEKEIVPKSQDFDALLEKAKSKSWKGRQEIISDFKRQLRHLNEMIGSLSEGTHNVLFRKKPKPKSEDLAEIITDDHKVNQYLELERNEVRKNVERYRQNLVISQDVMKERLERLTNMIERLEEEIRIIRNKLLISSKQISEKVIQQFHSNQNELKAKFKEKVNESREIEILEQEFSRNNIMKENLDVALATQKQTLKEKEEKLSLLKGETAEMSKNAKKEKDKEDKMWKEKLESVEKGYDKFDIKSENLYVQLTDSKHRLEKIRRLQQQKTSYSFMRKSLFTCSVHHYRKVNDSELSMKIPGNRTAAYKNKLLMYQSIFYALEGKNENKLKKFADLINDTEGWTFDFVENRCLMWEIASDIKSLKSRNKKLTKTVLCSTKQNFVKKKSSSLQLMEVLNERKTYLAIKKKENQCLTLLIRNVLSIKDDDCNLLQSLLRKNKDVFLKNQLI